MTTGDKLVDDALGGVAEVAELGLPHDQRVGVGHGVAKLKAQDAVLTEGAVADGVGCLVGVEVGQGVVGGHVDGLVVQNVMALGEGATLNILTYK